MSDTDGKPTTMTSGMSVERRSDRELVMTRVVNGPARLVFEAWARPELFQRWWVPTSFGMTLISCEADVRTGARYAGSRAFGQHRRASRLCSKPRRRGSHRFE